MCFSTVLVSLVHASYSHHHIFAAVLLVTVMLEVFFHEFGQPRACHN
jgi:hypothetical protein